MEGAARCLLFGGFRLRRHIDRRYRNQLQYASSTRMNLIKTHQDSVSMQCFEKHASSLLCLPRLKEEDAEYAEKEDENVDSQARC